VILLLEEARKLYVRRVLLPAPSVAIPVPVPFASYSKTESFQAKGVRRQPFAEVGSPVLVMGFSGMRVETALPVAMRLAEQSGSKILIASDHKLPTSQQKYLSAESRVPIEYTQLDIPEGSKKMRSAASAMRKYADRMGSEMIVLPVSRDVFAGRTSRRTVGWIEEFSGRRVVLVAGPSRPSLALEPPNRLLIPILDDFHPEVFALAGALTSASHIPDVDVVAARVIKMPPTVPLYSTFLPESLVDSDKELSFMKTLSGLPLLRRLSARVLLVRDSSRDLINFAEERRVDLIVLKGDWAASRHGFLPKTERRIAAKASCYVAVLLSSGH